MLNTTSLNSLIREIGACHTNCMVKCGRAVLERMVNQQVIMQQAYGWITFDLDLKDVVRVYALQLEPFLIQNCT